MQALIRRARGFGLAALCTLPLAAGCETLDRHRGRHDTDPEVARTSKTGDDSESSKILDVQSEPSKPKPFFKSSRLPGGLSDEAREIERDVGIR